MNNNERNNMFCMYNTIVSYYRDFEIHITIMIFILGRDDEDSKDSWLFTGALYNGYGPPKGFCFDQ